MPLQSFATKTKEWNPILTLLLVVLIVATAITVLVLIQGYLGNHLDRIDTRFDLLNAHLNTTQSA